MCPEIRTYAVMKLAAKRGHFRNGKWPLVVTLGATRADWSQVFETVFRRPAATADSPGRQPSSFYCDMKPETLELENS